jgi:Nif-specific regulatory protein
VPHERKRQIRRPDRTAAERELQLLYHVSRLLDTSLDLREIVSPVLEALAEHMDMNYGTLTLLNRKTGDILIEAAHGLSPQQARRGRYKLGEGVTGQVILTGEPAVIPAQERVAAAAGQDPARQGRRHLLHLRADQGGPGSGGRAQRGPDLRPTRPAGGRPPAQHHRLPDRAGGQAAPRCPGGARPAGRGERAPEAGAAERFRPSNIIGNSHEMQLVYDQIAQVSKSNATVLILGETGTGKELVAHAIHYNSDRADKPFVKAHCAALPENLIESELFGHVKGAFTGAIERPQGPL